MSETASLFSPAEAPASTGATVVPVLVPLPTERPYSYAVPAGSSVEPGAIVQVPLGPRQVAGLVWDGEGDDIDARKLRPITRVFDCPPIDAATRRFIAWMADYTLTPPGLVARMVLRAPAAFEPEPWIDGLQATGLTPERLTAARRRVLELAGESPAWSKAGLAGTAGVSASVVDGLVKLGAFEPVRAGRFFPTLLEGVTGSGKTEVYCEAIAEAIAEGGQVLVLLPEIALTQNFLDRLHARFGAPPADWHSDLAPKKREKVWRQVAEGRVSIVAGARSALFLPFGDLRLIVVDEEHDPAYKQEERGNYHARDMAVVRASIAGCAVVLASATPSVETRVNADRGRYGHRRLTGRFAEAAMPSLDLVDLRRDAPPRGRFLSPKLETAIAETLSRGEQTLIFLNRRGYAPLTLCRVCGHRFQCGNCSAWLVDHRLRGKLQCHHCGFETPRPEACPECGTLDHLVACGPGVERIAEEIVTVFPQARTLLLSSDLPGGTRRLRRELDAIADGEADIVIGTQLVAKGHHFPEMTLVGAVDADIGLSTSDPRAAERTFQLLHQVTGRAGRTGKASRGLIQTFQPEHPVMQAIASGDTERFYEREIAERERAGLPPFGRLAAIVVSAETRAAAVDHARALRLAAREPDDGSIHIMGPAEAPLAILRGRHRFRLLVHATRSAPIQSFLRATLAAADKPRGSVQVQIDVDPQSFL